MVAVLQLVARQPRTPRRQSSVFLLSALLGSALPVCDGTQCLRLVKTCLCLMAGAGRHPVNPRYGPRV